MSVTPPAIPADAITYVRDVFAECNSRVTEKLSMAPNVQEESLDLSWIEQLSHRSSPTTLPSSWTVAIESHYLGGLRHFRNWEIADIGVLVFVRLPGGAHINKVALLQSKRLYPSHGEVREETRGDFETGIARLADPESFSLSVGLARSYTFEAESRYNALRLDANQGKAIEDYEKDRRLRVYYQLYNPWSVPWAQTIPLNGYSAPAGAPDLGVRIVPSSTLRSHVAHDRSPRLSDVAGAPGLPAYGWRLEDFICDEVLGCREGDQFNTIEDAPIQSLFYRRSGPISAAIAVTIEAPDAQLAPMPAT